MTDDDKRDIATTTVSTVTEAISAITGTPLGTVSTAVSAAYSKWLRGRNDKGTEILLDEIRSGRRFPEDVELDSLFPCLHRFFRAAQEGAATLNLRLMARVIGGQLESRELIADEFLHFADIIAGMRRDEIVVAGSLYRLAHLDEYASGRDAADNVAKFYWEGLCECLVPATFASETDPRATTEALQRTGLVITPGADLFGIGLFLPSPLLQRFGKLAALGESLGPDGVKL